MIKQVRVAASALRMHLGSLVVCGEASLCALAVYSLAHQRTLKGHITPTCRSPVGFLPPAASRKRSTATALLAASILILVSTLTDSVLGRNRYSKARALPLLQAQPRCQLCICTAANTCQRSITGSGEGEGGDYKLRLGLRRRLCKTVKS